MLTREEIKKKLNENSDWEPSPDASDEEWELFDEVYMEMRENGDLDEEVDEEDMNDSDHDDDDNDDDDNDDDDDDDDF